MGWSCSPYISYNINPNSEKMTYTLQLNVTVWTRGGSYNTLGTIPYEFDCPQATVKKPGVRFWQNKKYGKVWDKYPKYPSNSDTNIWSDIITVPADPRNAGVVDLHWTGRHIREIVTGRGYLSVDHKIKLEGIEYIASKKASLRADRTTCPQGQKIKISFNCSSPGNGYDAGWRYWDNHNGGTYETISAGKSSYEINTSNWSPGTYKIQIADRQLWGEDVKVGAWSDAVTVTITKPLPPPPPPKDKPPSLSVSDYSARPGQRVTVYIRGTNGKRWSLYINDTFLSSGTASSYSFTPSSYSTETYYGQERWRIHATCGNSPKSDNVYINKKVDPYRPSSIILSVEPFKFDISLPMHSLYYADTLAHVKGFLTKGNATIKEVEFHYTSSEISEKVYHDRDNNGEPMCMFKIGDAIGNNPSGETTDVSIWAVIKEEYMGKEYKQESFVTHITAEHFPMFKACLPPNDHNFVAIPYVYDKNGDFHFARVVFKK